MEMILESLSKVRINESLKKKPTKIKRTPRVDFEYHSKYGATLKGIKVTDEDRKLFENLYSRSSNLSIYKNRDNSLEVITDRQQLEISKIADGVYYVSTYKRNRWGTNSNTADKEEIWDFNK